MRVPLLPVIICLVAGLSADGYVLRRMKSLGVGRLWVWIYLIVAALATAGLAVVGFAPKKGAGEAGLTVLMWTIFAYFSIYIPKYLYVLISLAGVGIGRLVHRRSKWVDIVGAAIGLTFFAAMWWGALVTRYSLDVRRVDVAVAGLPAAFEGFRIVQLSDIHTGTFGDDPRFLEKMVKTVNDLNPDAVLFTGDIVNRHSDELLPFIDVLGGLKAPQGVWSVMGNHDYGEYYKWDSERDRLADVENLKRLQAEMGWKMLNNEHTVLRRGTDSIVIVGVENIGDPPFTTYGDLNRAYPTLGDKATKILMTHNPAHWVDSISGKAEMNVALTLSGHTHGMQIRILGWSPAALRYPTWGGLYRDYLGRALYVNIGIGEVGFPSRIGATPEVTLITLRRASEGNVKQEK